MKKNKSDEFFDEILGCTRLLFRSLTLGHQSHHLVLGAQLVGIYVPIAVTNTDSYFDQQASPESVDDNHSYRAIEANIKGLCNLRALLSIG